MSKLNTETIDPELTDLDLRSNSEILDVLLNSQRKAVLAVEGAGSSLADAVKCAAERLSANVSGRLILVGAGASGRLAVQDGAELWPTFGWPPERLQVCMAGGHDALIHSIEGAEDDVDAAHAQVAELHVKAEDVVVAVAASGRSPYTCAWLRSAAQAEALTIGLSNNPKTPLLESAQCPILLDTGPEILAGSTRMAAGTSQKIALNLFSTTLMIRLNRTYGNLMVDMAASNAKLDQRRIRLLQGVLPHLPVEQASQALSQADGWVKLAALIASGDTPEQARNRLHTHNGSLRKALADQSQSD